MDYLFNKEEEKVDAPVVEEVKVEETPVVVEAPVVNTPVETPAIEETPKVEEAPVAPTAITNNFGQSTAEVQAVGSVADGAIGVTSAPKPAAKKSAAKKAEKPETVAIHSTKNVTWDGVGKVYRGYNIVTKDASAKWLTRSHVRLATPEEVAKEFGK